MYYYNTAEYDKHIFDRSSGCVMDDIMNDGWYIQVIEVVALLEPHCYYYYHQMVILIIMVDINIHRDRYQHIQLDINHMNMNQLFNIIHQQPSDYQSYTITPSYHHIIVTPYPVTSHQSYDTLIHHGVMITYLYYCRMLIDHIMVVIINIH